MRACVCVRVCMCACVYVCVVCACVHAFLCALCVRACIYLCMHTCSVVLLFEAPQKKYRYQSIRQQSEFICVLMGKSLVDT